jgi:hypothetical protein
MEVKFKEEPDTKIEIQNFDEITKIEKKMKALGYMPIHAFIVGMLMSLITIYYDNPPFSIIISSLTASIALTSIANVQRTNLLKKLFELKYGK